MTIPWLNLSILVGLVFMLATPVLADFQAGLDAYERGEFEAARMERQPLEELSDKARDVRFLIEKLVLDELAEANLPKELKSRVKHPRDDDTLVKELRPLAEQGDAEAQANLWAMYYKGRGVLQDYVLAHMWTNLAAAQGNEDAIKARSNLDKLMTQDQLAEAQRLAREWKAKHRGDDDTLVKELRPLAEQGDALGQVFLGILYLQGQGVPQDNQEGSRWFRLAAEQGDALGQVFLGGSYFKGLGVPQDYVLAHMWVNLGVAHMGVALVAANDRHEEFKFMGEESMAWEDRMMDFIFLRDEIQSHMTPAQVAEAQRLAREWKATGE